MHEVPEWVENNMNSSREYDSQPGIIPVANLPAINYTYCLMFVSYGRNRLNLKIVIAARVTCRYAVAVGM